MVSLGKLMFAKICGAIARVFQPSVVMRPPLRLFPPGPALVMLPFAAIWGYDTNDVLITIIFGGLNALLLFMVLELLAARGHSARTREEHLWLTLMFAFGTVAFFVSVRGEVWFTALVMGVTFNLAFMLAALDLKRPLLAGLLLGLGMATRTPLAFCFVFFAWQLFFPWRSLAAGALDRDLENRHPICAADSGYRHLVDGLQPCALWPSF